MAKYQYGEYVMAKRGKAKIVSVWKAGANMFTAAVGSGIKYTVEYSWDGKREDCDEIDLNPYHPGATQPTKTNSNSQPTLNYGNFGEEYNKAFAKYDNDTSCPKCGDKWHVIESPFRGKEELWYTCNKCNKKREDIKLEIEKDKKEDKPLETGDFAYGF